MTDPNILIPLIRKLLPSTIAQDIVGVQPMQDSIGSIFKGFIEEHGFNEKYWPYIKTVSLNQFRDAEKFCYKSFKSRNWRNRGRHFAFKRQSDYEWFLLRWS